MPWTKEAREKAILAKRKKGITNQYTKAKKLNLPIPVSRCKGNSGHFLGKKHSNETKEILREKALSSNHRRLVKSTRKYITKTGETILLDSSWEERLAKNLDNANISWIRPNPIKWIDKTGKQRNYFPDFYLIEYDLYLDPKNPAAMKQQREKVIWLKENIKNLIFLENEKDIDHFCSRIGSDF